jgi:hypothetical protein
LYIKFKEGFAFKIAVPVALVIYIALMLKYGNLNLYTQNGFVLTIGTFRGIAGLSLGCALGRIVDIKPVLHLNINILYQLYILH